MLIGGPNQSHKVNFKEPLPVKGKISKRTFAVCSVNTFPELVEKSFGKEHRILKPFVHPARVWREALNKGSGNMGIAFS